MRKKKVREIEEQYIIQKALPSDYTKFEMNPFTRITSDSNYTKLIESMLQHGFWPEKAIIVEPKGKKFVIVEGHHRFAAATSLGIPFYYIAIPPGTKRPSLAERELLSRIWKLKELVRAWSEQGNENYQILEKFSQEHAIPLSLASRLLAVPGTESGLKKGTFVADKRSKRADKVVAIMKAIAEYNPRIARNGYCARAAMNLTYLPEFSLDQMLTKIKNHPGRLQPQADVPGYMDLLEEIYNYHSRTKVDLSRPAQRKAKERSMRLRKKVK